jgi:hypothetical protein
MNIEEELTKLEREQAIKIIANVLKHFSSDGEGMTLAIAAAFTDDILGEGSVKLYLVAPPDPDCYKDWVLDKLDDGANYSHCEKCGVSLCTNYRHVLCPLCGTPLFAT